ncbi:MAG: PIN domain-containing protein, partial [Terriglobales bacterium]
YRRAAELYRLARGKGVTLATIDTLIAAIALEHGASVFTLDQDFSRIAPRGAGTIQVPRHGFSSKKLTFFIRAMR